ncbi:MAG: DUF1836 domain-containing protein [Lachnospiraceae bacterium]|nr:DUF1836 domain-containing protein [Lachnospiraceae bacterium]
MEYDKTKLTEAFEEWISGIEGNALPEWETIPSIELYMDQVIALINQYLEIFEADREEKDYVVTAAMVNNYVKMKIVPAPVKKRYTKVHLAYLVMVCTLKQTLSMEMIKKIIPVDMEEGQVRQVYASFVQNQKKTFVKLTELMREQSPETLTDAEDASDFALQSAIFSTLARTLTKKILGRT